MPETSNRYQEQDGTLTPAFAPDVPANRLPEEPVPFAGPHIPNGIITVEGKDIKVDQKRPEHRISPEKTDARAVKAFRQSFTITHVARPGLLHAEAILREPDNHSTAHLEKEDAN